MKNKKDLNNILKEVKVMREHDKKFLLWMIIIFSVGILLSSSSIFLDNIFRAVSSSIGLLLMTLVLLMVFYDAMNEKR